MQKFLHRSDLAMQGLLRQEYGAAAYAVCPVEPTPV